MLEFYQWAKPEPLLLILVILSMATAVEASTLWSHAYMLDIPVRNVPLSQRIWHEMRNKGRIP